jgi:hypothetical protein
MGGLHRPSTRSVPPGGHPRSNPKTCVFPRTLSGFGLPSYISSEIDAVGRDHITTRAQNCLRTGGIWVAGCQIARLPPYNGPALSPHGTWRYFRGCQPPEIHRVAGDGTRTAPATAGTPDVSRSPTRLRAPSIEVSRPPWDGRWVGRMYGGRGQARPCHGYMCSSGQRHRLPRGVVVSRLIATPMRSACGSVYMSMCCQGSPD